VIEHNYERDGQIIIPAGSRAVGKITQADPSGLMNITFSSIEFASGETVPVEAVAADMSLAAINTCITDVVGNAHAKHVIFAEGAIRESRAVKSHGAIAFGPRRNRGDDRWSAHEQTMRMLTMQHIVVSVPAGAEIYLIFAKSQALPASHETSPKVETTSLPATQ